MAKGYVIARHAVVALAKMAKKVKAMGGQLIAEFMHFVLMLGVWAARVVAVFIELPRMIKTKRIRGQLAFQLHDFFA